MPTERSFNVSRDPGDGWRRSDSGEARVGTKASKTILVKDALFPYQKEKIVQNLIRKEGRRVEMLSELVATN